MDFLTTNKSLSPPPRKQSTNTQRERVIRGKEKKVCVHVRDREREGRKNKGKNERKNERYE